ncbi:hypothetical protein Drorol1_Dr00026462, partial [Drosera rotundifolia]
VPVPTTQSPIGPECHLYEKWCSDLMNLTPFEYKTRKPHTSQTNNSCQKKKNPQHNDHIFPLQNQNPRTSLNPKTQFHKTHQNPQCRKSPTARRLFFFVISLLNLPVESL